MSSLARRIARKHSRTQYKKDMLEHFNKHLDEYSNATTEQRQERIHGRKHVDRTDL